MPVLQTNNARKSLPVKNRKPTRAVAAMYSVLRRGGMGLFIFPAPEESGRGRLAKTQVPPCWRKQEISANRLEVGVRQK